MSYVMHPDECDCCCHGPAEVWHCLPCCDGECTGCGRPIKDFEEHKKRCPNAEEPITRLLREYEKREEND